MAAPPAISGKGLRCQSPIATTVPTANKLVIRSGTARTRQGIRQPQPLDKLFLTVSGSSPGLLCRDFGVVDGEPEDQAHGDHDDRHDTER
jgi:hypothetical protein